MNGNEPKGRAIRMAATAAILAFGVAASPGSNAQPPSGLVVFGTSLSDPGNAYAALGEANTPPDWSVDMFLVPDRPYARGGHHFSNGATWVEQMARPLGLAAAAKGAFTPGGGMNFAFGGARARNVGASPSLGMQIGAFLQATGGVAPANALYVVEMGGNDMRDALEKLREDPSGGETLQILGEALGAVVGGIQALHAAGARNFLIWNMPNIGVTPAINRDVLVAALAGQFAQIYNSQLSTALGGMPGVAILDVNGKLSEVVNSAASFGLANVADACVSVAAPFACAQPNDYLFWDGIHPSAAGHAILAHAAAAAIGH